LGNLRNVAASYQSTLGEIKSAWSRSGNALRMDVTIPSGATATVLFPTTYGKSITVNGGALASKKTIRNIHLENTAPSCIVGAGTYRFEAMR